MSLITKYKEYIEKVEKEFYTSSTIPFICQQAINCPPTKNLLFAFLTGKEKKMFVMDLTTNEKIEL